MGASMKKATLIFLSILIVVALAYIKTALSFSSGARSTGMMNSSTYPILLSCLLIVLCVISFIQTLREKESKTDVIDFKLIGATICITILYFAIWNFIGYFYLATFVYIVALILIYQKKLNVKAFLQYGVISFVSTIAIYIIFDFMMGIQL